MNSATLRVGDQPPLADHDQVVGGLRHLAHQVAGDEDRAALGGQLASCSVADPQDALGVEPVDRLVEQQDLRVAEQRGGDAEPLRHARGRSPPTRRPATAAQADQRPAPRRPGGRGMPLVWARRAGGCGRCARRARPWRPAARRPCAAGVCSSRYGRPSTVDRAARSAGPGRGSCAWWWTCPAPFGPEEAGDRPGRTVKDRSSTATVGPYRLVSSVDLDHDSSLAAPRPDGLRPATESSPWEHGTAHTPGRASAPRLRLRAAGTGVHPEAAFAAGAPVRSSPPHSATRSAMPPSPNPPPGAAFGASRRRGPRPRPRPAVGEQHAGRAPRACLRVLVRASWTIR